MLVCAYRKIQTLRWVDLIGGNEPHIKIQPRPEWNYVPKKHHCRDIPIADPELWAQLMRRKMMLSRFSPLVFHTKSGKPQTHLWDDTQAIFKKTNVDMVKAHPHCFPANVLYNPVAPERADAGHHEHDGTQGRAEHDALHGRAPK